MKFSPLSKRYIGVELPLQVCKSNAGYYIGAKMRDGTPASRDSREYYRTAELAQKALDSGTFSQRETP